MPRKTVSLAQDRANSLTKYEYYKSARECYAFLPDVHAQAHGPEGIEVSKNTARIFAA